MQITAYFYKFNKITFKFRKVTFKVKFRKAGAPSLNALGPPVMASAPAASTLTEGSSEGPKRKR